MNNISKTITATAALLLLLTGCSQQQVSGSGDSSQVAGSGDSSQVAGSSQQVAGDSSQSAGSSQQAAKDSGASASDISANCPSCNAPEVKPVATPKVAASGHTHPANKCTNSIRHNHPNGSRSHSHKYSCQGNGHHGGGHVHPANKCTKSIRHNHRSNNPKHHHKYSCKGNNNSVDIHALQRKLKAKGYYRGPINGVINPGTRSALQRYQQRR